MRRYIAFALLLLVAGLLLAAGSVHSHGAAHICGVCSFGATLVGASLPALVGLLPALVYAGRASAIFSAVRRDCMRLTQAGRAPPLPC
jgi:hypothetical protein